MTGASYTLVELSKLLNNLLRIGVLSQVDTDSAKVRVKSGDLETNWIPWLSARAGKNAQWNPPEVGEQVMMLSPGGDLAQAVALPALYSTANPAPSKDKAVFKDLFKNGDYIQHDNNSGVLTLKATSIRILGPVTQTGGDMTSDGVSAQHHTHGGVLSGPASTGAPN